MTNLSQNLLAQNPSGLGSIGSGPGFGPLNVFNTDESPFVALSSVISTIIGFITVVAGLYFLFQFIIGALNYISASGDKTKLQGAQDRISNAIVGLILVVAAYAIVGVVGSVLGIDIFLENQEALVGALNLTSPP